MPGKENYVVDEILTTERTYCKFLKVVHEVYVIPLLQKYITKIQNINKDTLSFLHSFESILGIHDKMLAEMEAGNPDEDLKVKQDRIINALMKHVQLFKLYQPYLQNFSTSLKVLQGLAERELKTFFNTAAENKECAGYNLESLLIMPVQRIPRYRLLLQELQKQYKDPEKDKDIIKQLADALVIVCELAKKCNDSVENMSERVKLMEIYERFDNDPRVTNKASRKFLDVIDLNEVTRHSTKPITLILFNDVFMLADVINDKVEPSKLSYLYSYDLKHTSVKDIPDTYISFTFSIYTPTKNILLQCKDVSQKLQWMELVQKAIDDRITYSLEVQDKVNIIMDDHCMNSVCSNRILTSKSEKRICHLCSKTICKSCSCNLSIQTKDKTISIIICSDCSKNSKDKSLNISNPVLLIDPNKIPSCWKYEVSSNGSSYHYVNVITKQVSLIHPQAALYLDKLYSNEIVPIGWRRCYTDQGDKYYLNLYSNKTQWELPTEAANPENN